MLRPPIIKPDASPGERARARTLLSRAFGLFLVLYFANLTIAACADVAAALFLYVPPDLARPGVHGYPELLARRAMTLDPLAWFTEGGFAVPAVVAGALIVRHPHSGPTWTRSRP